MRKTRILLVLSCLVLSASVGFTLRADEVPVLAVLEHNDDQTPNRAVIPFQLGVVKSPLAGWPHTVWTLREGDTLVQEYNPPSRFIKFVHLSGNAQQILCNVVVRYTPSAKGWRPSYLLLQLSPTIWDGEKAVPRPGMGTREPVQIVESAEPAGDGFYHALRFRLGSGPTQITAWEVQ